MFTTIQYNVLCNLPNEYFYYDSNNTFRCINKLLIGYTYLYQPLQFSTELCIINQSINSHHHHHHHLYSNES